MKLYPLCTIIGLTLALLLGASMVGGAEVMPATIVLEKAVHFTAPDGNDLLVPAGTYGVAADGERLRLTRDKAEAVLVIEAEHGSHDRNIELPIAITIPGVGEAADLLFLELYLPDRTSLQSTGSFSGVRGRGFNDHAQQFRQKMRESVRNVAEGIPATIVLEKAVHFTTPDGDDLLVPAGPYGVAADGERLRLTRDKVAAAFVIEAHRGLHDRNIELPIAVMIPGEGEDSDLILVGLLLPDHDSFETIGSMSGVRERGFRDRAQQFRETAKAKIAQMAANIAQQASQVAVAVCKAALRTRPASLAPLGVAKAQARPILQNPQFRQFAQEAMRVVLRDKKDAIQRLVEEVRYLASPQNRDKIKSLLSGERICERPFQATVAGIRQVYAPMPRSRAVQPAPAFGTLALSGEAEYIAGVQGAIGLILGAGETPSYGRLFWSVGGTVVTDVDAKGAVKVGMSFEAPPEGIENNFELSVKGGVEGGIGVAIELHLAWNRIRDEWQAKKLKSLIPYVSGFEIGPSGSVTPGGGVGLDIGYTRVTRFAW